MSPRFWRSPWHLSAVTALCLLLSPAGDAAARKFQMSGTWIARNGQVFIPLQFAASVMDGTGFIHGSMGNLTGAFFFPNGPIPGQGGVTATGSAPATLRIPPHRFVEDLMAGIPLQRFPIVQITTKGGHIPDVGNDRRIIPRFAESHAPPPSTARGGSAAHPLCLGEKERSLPLARGSSPSHPDQEPRPAAGWALPLLGGE
jgi:hypothetical protein